MILPRRFEATDSPWLKSGVVVTVRFLPIGVAAGLAVVIGVIDGRYLTIALGGSGALATAVWTWKRSEPLLLAAIVCFGMGFVSAIASRSTAERALSSVAFAAGLYLLHALATLALVTEGQPALHRHVVIRWARRTLTAISVGAVAGSWSFFLATRGHTANWLGYLGIGAVVSVGVLPIALLLSTKDRANES